MKSYNDTPVVCSGSAIRCVGFSAQVDQTPVQVKEALRDSEGLVELTHEGVATYIDASVVVAITPIFRTVSS